MKDSVLEGVRGGATPRVEGWRVLVESGGMGSKIALAGPHWMDTAGQQFGEVHERMGGQGGAERIFWWGGSEGDPLSKEDSP